MNGNGKKARTRMLIHNTCSNAPLAESTAPVSDGNTATRYSVADATMTAPKYPRIALPRSETSAPAMKLTSNNKPISREFRKASRKSDWPAMEAMAGPQTATTMIFSQVSDRTTWSRTSQDPPPPPPPVGMVTVSVLSQLVGVWLTLHS